MEQALRESLSCAVDLLSGSQHPWWIYGSCALALYGVNPGEINDVDVLMSEPDADALFRREGWSGETSGTALFHSAYFHRLKRTGPDIEFMAGMRVRSGEDWQAFSFKTRKAITLLGREVFVPDLDEIAASLRQFGRPKDHERLALIERYQS